MLEARVESIIKNVILSTSKKEGIGLESLRVKLTLSEDEKDICFYALNKNELVCKIDWISYLGLLEKPFKGTIVNTIGGKLKGMAESLKIETKEANIRIFPIDVKGNFELQLTRLDKGVKKITISDLV